MTSTGSSPGRWPTDRTGLLVGVYAGLVLLATEVLQLKSPVAVAGSTLVAAALFSPLRSRGQRAVDQRVQPGPL